jgi:hypothetical protein
LRTGNQILYRIKKYVNILLFPPLQSTEPGKPARRPFVPKIPSKMSLRVALQETPYLEKQVSGLLNSAKPPANPGKS